MTESEKLRDFLKSNLEFMEHEGSSGHNFEFPDFELLPMDYLKFANNEIEKKNDSHHLINCVAHLKRAAECEIDTFLYVCNLYKVTEKRNLSFDAKLTFLKDIGIFNSRTLSRFNSIRNKIEHEYSVPEIEEIEVYYDLVSALVELLEGSMFVLAHATSELEYELNIEDEDVVGKFKIEYKYDEPCIKVYWEKGEEKRELLANLRHNREDFTYFFKVLFLLNKHSCIINDDYLLECL